MVQLKVSQGNGDVSKGEESQFLHGSIKSVEAQASKNAGDISQFLHGSIKSLTALPQSVCWYNNNLNSGTNPRFAR